MGPCHGYNYERNARVTQSVECLPSVLPFAYSHNGVSLKGWASRKESVLYASAAVTGKSQEILPPVASTSLCSVSETMSTADILTDGYKDLRRATAVTSKYQTMSEGI